MNTLIQIALLTLRTLQVFPDADPARAVVVARYAVLAEQTARDFGYRIPAELLVAIAEHESKLHPNAVSYVGPGGKRVDLLWAGEALPSRVVCGYLQAMATPSTCAEMVALDGGMTAAAAELREWFDTCRGDVRCVLRGHAGGTACSRDRSRCSRHAAIFARIFYSRAVTLGMEDLWKRPPRPDRSARSSARMPLELAASR